MIDLFYPPIVEHKNAKKVKGKASMGAVDEIHFEVWLKAKQVKDAKKKSMKEATRKQIKEHKQKMDEAKGKYDSAYKAYQELATEMRRLRRFHDNRRRTYDRAYQSFKKTFGEEP